MVTALKRICCRCGATFSVDKSGKHTRREECNYHYGKVIENRGKNGLECLYFFFSFYQELLFTLYVFSHSAGRC